MVLKRGSPVIVLLEYDGFEKRVYFRGVWPRDTFVAPPPRRPENQQNAVETFFDTSHNVRAFVGLSPG